MAKRGKRIYENPPKDSNLPQLTEWIQDQFNNNQDQAVLMMSLFCLGVSPEKYQTFYESVAKTPAGKKIQEHPELADLLTGICDNATKDEEDILGFGIPDRQAFIIPLKDADSKTFKLKLQLKGVTKPPVWREILIPANYNFYQLHEIIQAVFNWDDSHLWHFEEKAYDSVYVITSDPENDFDMHHQSFYDPEDTSISSILKKKDDKIEYLYDFGDDWIVSISVKELIDKKISNAEVINFKGDNMVDNIGGIWGYMQYREVYDNLDKISQKKMNEFLELTWFDSKEEFKEFMDNLKFDINYANNLIKNI